MAARRGEIWRTGDRPALLVSDDRLNSSAAGLVIFVPLTRTYGAVPWHVEIEPPEGGVRARSYAMCEQVRAISVDRLRDGPWGPPISTALMAEVDRRLRLLLGL